MTKIYEVVWQYENKKPHSKKWKQKAAALRQAAEIKETCKNVRVNEIEWDNLELEPKTTKIA